MPQIRAHYSGHFYTQNTGDFILRAPSVRLLDLCTTTVDTRHTIVEAFTSKYRPALARYYEAHPDLNLLVS